MGVFKQLSIDIESQVLTSEMTRIYNMNGNHLTREEFISKVALCIYDTEPNTDIRKTIDLLLNDADMKELVCSGGNKFFSYLSDGDIVEREERPLKTYKVSYDILIVPTIPIAQRKKSYKRLEEIVQATSFREAREMVRQALTDLDRVTKSFVVELYNTEADI